MKLAGFVLVMFTLFSKVLSFSTPRSSFASRARSSVRLYKTNPNRMGRENRPFKLNVETKEKAVKNSVPTMEFDMMIEGITATAILEKGKARLFQDGNPIVYGGAIGSIQGSPVSGDQIMICDHNGNLIARGIYNSESMYRVRVLVTKDETSLFSLPIEDLLAVRFANALRMRATTLGVGESERNDEVFRLINGEGDRLGGLIVDVIGNVIVAQSSAAWCEKHKDAIMQELTKLNIGNLASTVVWRRAVSRLNQDGFHSSDSSDAEPIEDSAEDIVVKEGNCQYSVNPLGGGQKTGFYCDQRENRKRIMKLSDGKTVLDTYCYTGGFSINAALGGAKSVTSVDSSQPALDSFAKNLVLNNLSDGVVDIVKADAVAFMKKCAEEGKQFDIVICDPPKLAPSRKDLDRAKNKYKKINQLGLSLVKPGGLFLTCACSGAMTQDPLLFKRIIADAGRASKRDVTIINTSGAAMDHPVHPAYPEGAYLTAVLVHVN